MGISRFAATRLTRLIIACAALATALTPLAAVAQIERGQPLCEAWQRIGPKVSVGVMAYDAHRRVCVLLLPGPFGTKQNDTWEWDGTTWRLRVISPPEVGGALCYDADRRVCVAYNSLDGVFWEWDGNAWTQRDVRGPTPSPRAGVGFVYDSARRVYVLFGGRFPSGVYSGETWEFDGEEWTQRMIAGPTPRTVGSGMSFDSYRRMTVLFGGRGASGGGSLAGTWEYDGAQWIQREDNSSPIFGHVMAYDAARHATVRFGGDPNPACRVWNGSTWASADIDMPFFFVDRTGAAMAYDTHRARMVGFGGNVLHTRFSETWEMDLKGHVTVVDPSPLSDGEPAMVYDSLGDRTLLIDHRTPGRVLEYDGHKQQWTTHDSFGGAAPDAWRNHETVAFDSGRGRLVLFGGEINNLARNDLWEWDGRSWLQRLEPGPTARADHAMAFDAIRGECVVFGGQIGGPPGMWTLSGETWTWDGSAWTLRAIDGPSPRMSAAIAFDPLRGVVVLFGGATGTTSSSLLGDTWEWDGKVWTHVADKGPTARRDHSLTFDASRGRIVMYAGQVPHPSPGALTTSAEMWAWDGRAWTQLDDGPHSTCDAGLVFDNSRQRLMTFGGGGLSSLNNELWEYGNDLRFTAHPAPRRVLAGQTATFVAAVESASPVSLQWRKDREPIDGATGEQLVIANVQRSDAGEYDVVASNECGSRVSPPAALTIGQHCSSDVAPVGGNGAIDVDDLITIILGWGACPPPPVTCADTNGDGVVNVDDLILIINTWGACIE